MEAILLRTRLAVLRKVVQSEAELDRTYSKAVAALQRQLRGTPTAKVRATVLRKLRQINAEIAKSVERSISSGTIAGEAAAMEQFRALYKGESIGGFKFLSPAAKTSLTRKRVRGTLSVDNVALSRRLFKQNRTRGLQMAIQITATLRAGKSITDTADALIGLDIAGGFARRPPAVVIPRYIREISAAAKSAHVLGQPDLLQNAIRRHAKQIDRLGQAGPGFAQSMRPISKQFVKDIQKASADQVDKLVERWLLDKARRHARLIARTEAVEAYRASYIQATSGKPYVKGYRWTLANTHPEPDVCDILAKQDLFGLGPGGYPVDELPPTPHPLDLCIQTTIMDERHFERELAKRRGEKEPPKPWLSGKTETGAEWLARQPETFQRKLLGPTRLEIFKENPDAVLTRGGVPRSVKDAIRKNRS